MLTDEKLKRLLEDLESDRVERTVSTTDSTKFCEAICAFSNDISGSGQPGYLIVGARDDGTVAGIDITDRILQSLASHRETGTIVPLPVMTVTKYSLNGELAVVEVLPSDMPPVRFKGRIYIRCGPRKGIANEQEERLLTERRIHHAKTFDIQPCRGCGPDHLVLDLFQLAYRSAAIAPEVIEENRRDLFQQMASLGFWDAGALCASNAGALLFAESPLNWIPGAYIQYVHYEGESLDTPILNERQFDGDLVSLLRELDTFVEGLFPARPVHVSALREETRRPYPIRAVRELLMNAVMHRDYQSNAPIMFNRFSDRIEIQNPGGLFGAVTPENFPDQNDYRNPKIAEAMKTLGYVNRFRRGIIKVQALLKENGNPPAEFHIIQPAFFLAAVRGAGT